MKIDDFRDENGPTGKRAFIILLLSVITISFVVLSIYHPVEKGWWIFKYTEYPLQYLGSVAFIIGAAYVILLSAWYKPEHCRFSFKVSLLSFAACGLGSLLIAIFIFYPLWDAIAFKEVQSGWWFFANVEKQPIGTFFGALDATGADAGIVEELAKLLAVLAVPAVRNRLRTRKSALFYVTLCAFGFALIENIGYFCQAKEVIIMRANPAHAVFSAIWGGALGSWLSKEKPFGFFLQRLALGMGLHAAWNFFASIESLVFFLIFLLTSWKGLSFIRRELQAKDQR